MFDDLLHDIERNRNWDGETNALRAAALAEYGRVIADQHTMSINQRPTGITVIDGCIGLNEIFKDIQADAITTGSTGQSTAWAQRSHSGIGSATDVWIHV